MYDLRYMQEKILNFPFSHVSIFCPYVLRDNYIYNCSSVEISPSLAEIQRQTVGEVRSHQSKFSVECRDAVDLSGWGMFSYISLNYSFQVLSIICILLSWAVCGWMDGWGVASSLKSYMDE